MDYKKFEETVMKEPFITHQTVLILLEICKDLKELKQELKKK